MPFIFYLCQLKSMKNKAFMMIGISRCMKPSLWAITSPSQTVLWSLHLRCLLSGLAPSDVSVLCLSPTPRFLQSTHSPPSNPFCWNYLNTGITANLHSILLFFTAHGTNFHIIFNLILPSQSSRQLYTTTSNRPQYKTMILSTLTTIPPQSHHNPSSFQISIFPSWEFPSVS